MRLRKLALAVGLASVLGAEMASALGLGEIKLLSTLNQPLEAEIKLLQAKDLSKDEILIGLAANEDFQRAGIDRLYFLTDLKFSVRLEGPDGPVIKVSSRKPVREPYLNFLLETQWPNGRILREYTLLMDLPVFSDESIRPVESARTSTARTAASPSPSKIIPRAPAQTQAAEPAKPKPQRKQAQPTSPKAQYGSDVYGPVGSNDTLWEIALKVRPNRGYSVQQTMLAIQRLNPEAFINGNINLLRKGQVLRVPEAVDIDAVTERQAVNQVAQQNNQWSGNASGQSEAAQLEGSKRRTSTSTPQQSVSGRLKVAGGEARENLQAGRAAGEVGGDIESLQNDLAISMEELDRSRRDNNELKDRVEELEDQIQTMERLLTVSSQELRAMQLGSKANDAVEQAAQEPSSEVSTSDSEPASAVEGTEAAMTTEPGSAEPVAATEAAPAAAVKKVDATKVVRSAKPKESSFMDLIMDNMLYVGGALVALLAGVFLLMRRRKDEGEDEALEFDYEEPVAEESIADELDVPEASVEAEDELELQDDVEDSLVEEEFDLDDAVTTESQTGDAVGEADIYIAYGKFDQAEEMLLAALESDDQDSAARLKLMEVYVETQELDKFDHQYSAVQASGNADAMTRATDLRQQFDDAPAYIAMSEEASGDDGLESLAEVESLAPAADSTEDSFDFDFGEEQSAPSADEELSLDEDFGLNFESNLTGDTAESADSDEEFTLDIEDELSATELDDDLGLDLDLDLQADTTEASDTAVDDSLGLDLELGTIEADAEVAGDDFTLDLDDTDFSSDGLDLDLSLDGDDNSDTGGFDLDLDLDEVEELEVDLGLDDAGAERKTSGLDIMDFSAEDESTASNTLELIEDAELPLDSSADVASEIESLDVADNDLDADLAALDTELGGDLALDLDLDTNLDTDSLSENDELPTLDDADDNSFDLALDDTNEGDAFDVEVGDIDLDALDQEVDALAADLDVSEVVAADMAEEPVLSADSDDFDLDLDLDLDASEGVDVLAEELDAGEVPALEALEIEDQAEIEVEAETEAEFDLAADLGLSAEDLESNNESSEDEMFTEALSDLPMPEDVMADDEMTDEDLDAELDFLADTDEAATKLDLARAYIDMGDQDGAKDILDEVVEEGNDEQKQQAEELLARMS
jgi:pilus assembly protein FimV